jgi:hypothetical protein
MAAISTFKDGFQSNAIDSGVYAVSESGGGAVEAQNDRIELVCPSGGSSTITTVESFDLTGDGCFVKFSRVGGNGDCDAQFRLVDPSGDYYEIFFAGFGTGGNIHSAYNGSQFGGGRTAAGLEWVRLRESGGTIYFDTAPGSGDDPPTSWTNRESQTKAGGFDATAVKIRFRGNYTNGTTSTFAFDGLNAATTYEPPAADTIARGLYL